MGSEQKFIKTKFFFWVISS